jgi:hypothetical protein
MSVKIEVTGGVDQNVFSGVVWYGEKAHCGAVNGRGINEVNRYRNQFCPP